MIEGHGSNLRAVANSFREEMAAPKLVNLLILCRTHLDIPSKRKLNIQWNVHRKSENCSPYFTATMQLPLSYSKLHNVLLFKMSIFIAKSFDLPWTFVCLRVANVTKIATVIVSFVSEGLKH